MDTNTLLIQLLLYFFLPLWGIAGFVDWCCHRATKIESTSGLVESFMHSIMGLQIAVPILLCLLFEINVLVLLICVAVLFLHEIVAHLDVHYAAPKRKISIWEMHAHNYLSTLPLYMLSIIVVMKWPTALKLISFQWEGEMYFSRLEEVRGGSRYLFNYLLFMTVFCVFPYFEEFVRCLAVRLKRSSP